MKSNESITIINYLSPRQISARWNIHLESARRMMRDGRLPAMRIGNRLRVLLADVEKFEADNLVSQKAR